MFELQKNREELLERIEDFYTRKRYAQLRDLLLPMEAADIAKSIETEGKIENLIKAKGFQECMVYLADDKIDVLVKCSGMTDSEAAQIKDVILGEVAVPDSSISIIEIQ